MKKGEIEVGEGRLIKLLFKLSQEDDFDDYEDATEEMLEEYKPQAEALLHKLVNMAQKERTEILSSKKE